MSVALEKNIIAAMIKDREAYNLLQPIIKEGDFGVQGEVIYKYVEGFYEKDPEASHIDMDILRSSILRKHQKHTDMFNDLLDSMTECSVVNVLDEFVAMKKHSCAIELSGLLLSGQDKAIQEKMLEYQELLDVNYQEDQDDSILYQPDLVEFFSKKEDTGETFDVVPAKLNSILKGRVRRGHHILIYAVVEVGKCHAKGTEVLMYPYGKEKIENLQVGDQLLGPDSLPRTVQKLARGSEDMYRIEYPWGESYEVNENHILSLKQTTYKRKYGYDQYEICNVSVKEYLTWPKNKQRAFKGWKTAVEYPHKAVFSPYGLGVWLGDGTSDEASITTMDAPIEDFWKQLAKEYGLHTTEQVWENNRSKLIRATHGYNGHREHNRLLQLLDELQVRNNKHIPDIYKYNSETVRKELLAGLIDTDGSWNGRGAWEITQKRKTLAEDILWVSRSLGIHATINTKVVNNTEYYRVMLYPHMDMQLPIKLSRKQQTFKAFHKRSGLHFGINITPLGRGDYYGIQIDKDHLYVLNDFTVCHNTLFTLNMAAGFCRRGKKVLYLCNEEPVEDVLDRFLSRFTGIDIDHVRDDPVKTQEIANEYGFQNLLLVKSHAGTLAEIEKMLQTHKPDVLVVDQIKNLEIPGTQGDEMTTVIKASRFMRRMGKQYGVVAISVTQAGDTAFNRTVLRIRDVYNSKTSVAGDADLMIGIGMNESMEAQGRRMINLPKNKVSGRHEYFGVEFDTRHSKVKSL